MWKYFREIVDEHKKFWGRPQLDSLLKGIVLFGIALVIQKIADLYVANIHGVAVDDVLLNFLPSLDIDGLVIIFWMPLAKLSTDCGSNRKPFSPE